MFIKFVDFGFLFRVCIFFFLKNCMWNGIGKGKQTWLCSVLALICDFIPRFCLIFHVITANNDGAVHLLSIIQCWIILAQ